VYIVVVVLCVLLSSCVYLLYCVCITVFTLDDGLLARSHYSEGPATGHLDTGFSRFPSVYKQMLRWFPRHQVATTCFSCSPPDLNFLDPYFIFMYMHNNHCHQATAHLQLIIIIIIIIIIYHCRSHVTVHSAHRHYLQPLLKCLYHSSLHTHWVRTFWWLRRNGVRILIGVLNYGLNAIFPFYRYVLLDSHRAIVLETRTNMDIRGIFDDNCR